MREKGFEPLKALSHYASHIGVDKNLCSYSERNPFGRSGTPAYAGRRNRTFEGTKPQDVLVGS